MNFFNKLTIGSKILLSLLLTALLSIALTGYIGYEDGRKSLSTAVFEQLATLRNVQAEAIANDFIGSENFVLTLSEAQMVINATKEFKASLDKLENQELTSDQRLKLAKYYDEEFIPGLKKNIKGDPVSQTYMPFRPAEQYLQYHYIANNPYKKGEKANFDFASDGSEYSQVHKKFHHKFKNIIDRMGYYDMFLIDADSGQIVYTTAKEVDFVSNLKDGPFSGSGLAEAYRDALASRDPYYVNLVDFANYPASQGKASAFITTTVYDGENLIGVLVLQVSNTRLNQIMTFGGKWEEAGLGKTGETYLIGEDKFLRTDPRLFLQDQDSYFQALEKAGYSKEEIEKIKSVNSPILNQIIDTEGVRKALAGESGESFYKDYRQVPVLGAYQPVKIGDFRWALVSKMDEEEAFKAVRDLTGRLIATSLILVPLFTILSLFLARLLTGPINRLIAGTQKIAAGEKDVRVKIQSLDEIGKLADTFNSMAVSLDEQDQLLNEKNKKTKELLLNILPGPVAERLERGEQDLADSFPNVTVIYAEIFGFHEFSQDIKPGRTVALLNEIIGAFDELAQQYGIEKLKTVGSAYVAVAGLTDERLDHPKRAADFSFALINFIKTFNQKQNSNLSLDIGIHSGPVVAGVVGKTKFIYELWGETMNIAKEIHESPQDNMILVSESVYSDLAGLYDFRPVNNVTIKGIGTISVWSIHPLSSPGNPLITLSEADNE